MLRRPIEPRMLAKEEALFYAGFSATAFSQIKKRLGEKFTFPNPHPITKKYDRLLIDKWIEETGGIPSEIESEEAALIAKAQRGEV